jgi:hypothetical protein
MQLKVEQPKPEKVVLNFDKPEVENRKQETKAPEVGIKLRLSKPTPEVSEKKRKKKRERAGSHRFEESSSDDDDDTKRGEETHRLD